jgi:hypothetical protein
MNQLSQTNLKAMQNVGNLKIQLSGVVKDLELNILVNFF